MLRYISKKINIQYCSDIHLEFFNKYQYENFKKQFQVKAPILVLAGDIGYPTHTSYVDFLTHVNTQYEKVFLIAGNHEFYGSKMEPTIELIKNVVKPLSNVSFLDNSFEDYRGIRWIGSTLWSDVKDPKYQINDTKVISDMTVELYQALHDESKEFLEDALESTEDPCIVITHHLPIKELTLPQYCTPEFTPYHQWFHANLNDLLERNSSKGKGKSKCKGWFYGHTHASSVQWLSNIPFYCSPKGYPKENNSKCYSGDICEINIE